MDSLEGVVDQQIENIKEIPNLLVKGIKIVVIVLIIRLLIYLVGRFIDRTIHYRRGSKASLDARRASTLGEVLKNLFKYILYFIGGVSILDLFNVNTTSILATAGIGGLAIGFGAQSLVKDVITGFFIIFEDQYVVGDFVNIQGFEGVVEELGLRVTKLRDFSGDLHIIPNGNIDIVSNKNRGSMRALVTVTVAYDEDYKRVERVLNRLAESIKESNPAVVEGPSVLGIANLGDYGYSFTIVGRTTPMEQWNLEREIRKRVKEEFDREGIEIPYPKMVISGGSEDATKL